MLTDRSLDSLALAYLQAKEYVLEAGYAEEIDWQSARRIEDLTETDLLREAAWVILSGGMNERVIRRCFGSISREFHSWSSAKIIVDTAEHCREGALQHFNHGGKIDAILSVAGLIVSRGFDTLLETLQKDPLLELQCWPYLGPATSRHLAKNIGFQIAKPDRHLCRVSEVAGFPSPQDMCSALSEYLDEALPVVDLVIWRFATLNRDYLSLFSLASRPLS